MDLIELRQIYPGILLAISSQVHTLCSTPSGCDNDITNKLSQQLVNIVSNASLSNKEDRHQIILVLKAIGNAGISNIAIENIIEKFVDKSADINIRVAAIQARRRFPCRKDQILDLKLLKDTKEDVEVRIEAYLQIMRCPDYVRVQEIKKLLEQEEVNQVGSFIWTHLTNLQESSLPSLYLTQSLLHDEILTKKFKTDSLLYSRHYEKSLFYGNINMGGAIESNVIFSPESMFPRSAMVNLTANVFGRSINLFELGGRFKNLRYFYDVAMSPHGTGFSGPESLKVKPTKSHKYQSQLASEWQKMEDQLKEETAMDEPEISWYYKLFGDEIEHSNIEGSENIREILLDDLNPTRVMSIFDNLKSNYELQHSTQLFDGQYIIPSSGGFPIIAQAIVTSSVSLELTGNLQLLDYFKSGNILADIFFSPSGTVDVEASLVTDGIITKTGVQFDGRLHTSLSFNGKVTAQKNQLVDVKLMLPKPNMDIFEIKSKISLISNDVLQSPFNNAENEGGIHQCSGTVMESLFGLKFCFDSNFVKDKQSRKSPGFPLNFPSLLKLGLQKVNPEFKGYSLLYKWKEKEGVTKASAVFSSVYDSYQKDTSITFRNDEAASLTSFSIQSHRGPLEITGKISMKPDNFNLNSRIHLGDSPYLNITVSLQTKPSDEEWILYTPKIVIATDDITFLSVNGFIGSKLNATSFHSQKKFVLYFKVPSMNGTLEGNVIEKLTSQSLKATCTYQIESQTKESVQLNWSYRTFTTDELLTCSSRLAVQTTQFPERNFNLHFGYERSPGHLATTIVLDPNSSGNKKESNKLIFQQRYTVISDFKEQKMNSTISLRDQRSDINILLNLEYMKSSTQVSLITKLGYEEGKVIESGLFWRDDPNSDYAAGWVIKSPWGKLGIEGSILMNEMQQQKMTITAHFGGKRVVKLTTTYGNQPKTGHHGYLMSMNLNSTMFSDISVEVDSKYEDNGTKVAINLRVMDSDFRIQYKFTSPTEHSRIFFVSFDCCGTLYSITSHITFKNTYKMTIDVHLDRHRDIKCVFELQFRGQMKVFNIEVKWDNNKDPLKRILYNLELTNPSVGQYDLKSIIKIPSRTIRLHLSSNTHGQFGDDHFGYNYHCEVSWGLSQVVVLENTFSMNLQPHLDMEASLMLQTPMQGLTSNTLAFKYSDKPKSKDMDIKFEWPSGNVRTIYQFVDDSKEDTTNVAVHIKTMSTISIFDNSYFSVYYKHSLEEQSFKIDSKWVEDQFINFYVYDYRESNSDLEKNQWMINATSSLFDDNNVFGSLQYSFQKDEAHTHLVIQHGKRKYQIRIDGTKDMLNGKLGFQVAINTPISTFEAVRISSDLVLTDGSADSNVFIVLNDEEALIRSQVNYSTEGIALQVSVNNTITTTHYLRLETAFERQRLMGFKSNIHLIHNHLEIVKFDGEFDLTSWEQSTLIFRLNTLFENWEEVGLELQHKGLRDTGELTIAALIYYDYQKRGIEYHQKFQDRHLTSLRFTFAPVVVPAVSIKYQLDFPSDNRFIIIVGGSYGRNYVLDYRLECERGIPVNQHGLLKAIYTRDKKPIKVFIEGDFKLDSKYYLVAKMTPIKKDGMEKSILLNYEEDSTDLFTETHIDLLLNGLAEDLQYILEPSEGSVPIQFGTTSNVFGTSLKIRKYERKIEMSGELHGLSEQLPKLDLKGYLERDSALHSEFEIHANNEPQLVSYLHYIPKENVTFKIDATEILRDPFLIFLTYVSDGKTKQATHDIDGQIRLDQDYFNMKSQISFEENFLSQMHLNVNTSIKEARSINIKVKGTKKADSGMFDGSLELQSYQHFITDSKVITIQINYERKKGEFTISSHIKTPWDKNSPSRISGKLVRSDSSGNFDMTLTHHSDSVPEITIKGQFSQTPKGDLKVDIELYTEGTEGNMKTSLLLGQHTWELRSYYTVPSLGDWSEGYVTIIFQNDVTDFQNIHYEVKLASPTYFNTDKPIGMKLSYHDKKETAKEHTDGQLHLFTSPLRTPGYDVVLVAKLTKHLNTSVITSHMAVSLRDTEQELESIMFNSQVDKKSSKAETSLNYKRLSGETVHITSKLEKVLQGYRGQFDAQTPWEKLKLVHASLDYLFNENDKFIATLNIPEGKYTLIGDAVYNDIWDTKMSCKLTTPHKKSDIQGHIKTSLEEGVYHVLGKGEWGTDRFFEALFNHDNNHNRGTAKIESSLKHLKHGEVDYKFETDGKGNKLTINGFKNLKSMFNATIEYEEEHVRNYNVYHQVLIVESTYQPLGLETWIKSHKVDPIDGEISGKLFRPDIKQTYQSLNCTYRVHETEKFFRILADSSGTTLENSIQYLDKNGQTVLYTLLINSTTKYQVGYENGQKIKDSLQLKDHDPFTLSIIYPGRHFVLEGYNDLLYNKLNGLTYITLNKNDNSVPVKVTYDWARRQTSGHYKSEMIIGISYPELKHDIILKGVVSSTPQALLTSLFTLQYSDDPSTMLSIRSDIKKITPPNRKTDPIYLTEFHVTHPTTRLVFKLHKHWEHTNEKLISKTLMEYEKLDSVQPYTLSVDSVLDLKYYNFTVDIKSSNEESFQPHKYSGQVSNNKSLYQGSWSHWIAGEMKEYSEVNLDTHLPRLNIDLMLDDDCGLHVAVGKVHARQYIMKSYYSTADKVDSYFDAYLQLNHTRHLSSRVLWKTDFRNSRLWIDDVKLHITRELTHYHHKLEQFSNVWMEEFRHCRKNIVEDMLVYTQPLYNVVSSELAKLTTERSAMDPLIDLYKTDYLYVKTIFEGVMKFTSRLRIMDTLVSLLKTLTFDEFWGDLRLKVSTWLSKERMDPIPSDEGIFSSFGSFFKTFLQFQKFLLHELYVSVVDMADRGFQSVIIAVDEIFTDIYKVLYPQVLTITHKVDHIMWDYTTRFLEYIYDIKVNIYDYNRARIYLDKFSEDFSEFGNDMANANIKDNVLKYMEKTWRLMENKIRVIGKYGELALSVCTTAWNVLEAALQDPKMMSHAESFRIFFKNLHNLMDYFKVKDRLQSLVLTLYNDGSDIFFKNSIYHIDKSLDFKTSLFTDSNSGYIMFEQKLPFKWLDLEHSPDYNELPLISTVNNLLSLSEPSNSSQLPEIFRSMAFRSWKDLIPPYPAEAFIMNFTYFITFDGVHFTVQNSTCPLVLCHVSKGGVFTLIFDNSITSPHLLMLFEGKELRVDTSMQVTINNNPADLPLLEKNLEIKRDPEELVITIDQGVVLSCHARTRICRFRIPAWAFGNTNGLLGKYNNEVHDDKLTLKRDVNKWKIPTRECRDLVISTPDQLTQRYNNNADKHDTCSEHFKSIASPFRNCFEKVSPKSFQDLCIHDEALFCSLAQLYIESCQFHYIYLKLPYNCVKCQYNGKIYSESEREKLSVLNNTRGLRSSSADIVFVIELHNCNSDIIKLRKIDALIHQLQTSFKSSGFKNNRYAIVGFGNLYHYPFVKLYRSNIFMDSEEIIENFQTLSLGVNTTPDLISVNVALMYAAKLAFRPGVGVNIILLPCISCHRDYTDLNLFVDYTTIHRLLVEKGIKLHVLFSHNWAAVNQKKTYGIDAHSVFLKRRTKKVFESYKKYLILPKEELSFCMSLALDTNGTVFSKNNMMYPGKHSSLFLDSYTNRIVETSYPLDCYLCECYPGPSGMGTFDCKPCVVPVPPSFDENLDHIDEHAYLYKTDFDDTV